MHEILADGDRRLRPRRSRSCCQGKHFVYQLTAFYQYNEAVRQGTLNARFSWEFKPLSYLYVVLNDARDAGQPTLPGPRRQQLLVKLVYFGQR